MLSKKFEFIINPISGTKNKSAILKQIEKRIPNFVSEYEVFYTEGPEHATALAKEAVARKTDVVIAIGGDGTINETANGLLHSKTSLGIIPTGSGNGLGRHLGIPSQINKALDSLSTSSNFAMDVCTVNGIPFYNIAGVGYDAKVAHDFALRGTRGFFTYVNSVLTLWFTYSPKKYKLEFNTDTIKTKALLVCFANGSQFGNNAYIAPNASLNDGLMDISIISKPPLYAVPLFVYQLFTKKLEESKYTETFQTTEVIVNQKGKKIHLDGEPSKMGKMLHFKVLPHTLNIFAPKHFIDERN